MSGTDLASVPAGSRILPGLTVADPATAAPLAEALATGGAGCAEVTFRTPAAERVLKIMAAHGGLPPIGGVSHSLSAPTHHKEAIAS
ncbi:hypothetical protein ACIRPX_36540 [Streptomyces sp. NPDC101225]|uniref:hypothetical protein n=1 Tax=Streptomyces sp. NPDC101225 TaxID=3366135 RepID=UPI0037F6E1F8